MSNQPQSPAPSEPVLKSHRRPEDVSTTTVTVGDVVFGDGSYPVIAGPVAVESEEQIVGIATGVASAGAAMLRGGTFRAENSPYSFRGVRHQCTNNGVFAVGVSRSLARVIRSMKSCASCGPLVVSAVELCRLFAPSASAGAAAIFASSMLLHDAFGTWPWVYTGMTGVH